MSIIVMYEVPAEYLKIIDSFVYMLCDVHEVRNKYYLHFRQLQISFCRLFKCKEGYNMFVVVGPVHVCPVPVCLVPVCPVPMSVLVNNNLHILCKCMCC